MDVAIISAVSHQWQALTACTRLTHACPNSWVLVALLASPHFLYAFIWYRPRVWRRALGNEAVNVFAICASLGKLVQFTAVLLWWTCNREQGVCLDPARISLPQWLAALALVAVGQALNVGIYAAIGHDGVYYGFKLGKKIPWVSGWPFDAVSHPQYVGSVLTVWGMAALVWGQAPASLPVLVAVWTALYVVTGIQEDRL